MNIDFSIQELSIVILGRNHNPTVLNPDFLKINRIEGTLLTTRTFLSPRAAVGIYPIGVKTCHHTGPGDVFYPAIQIVDGDLGRALGPRDRGDQAAQLVTVCCHRPCRINGRFQPAGSY